MPPGSDTAEPDLRIDDLPAAAHVPAGAVFEIPEIPRGRLGLKVLQMLLGVLAVAVGVLVLVGWATYPSKPFTGVPSPEAYQAWTAAKTSWFNNLEQLGQVLLIAPFVSLLSATIGYMFGSQAQGA